MRFAFVTSHAIELVDERISLGETLEQAKVDLRRISDDTVVQSRSELTRDDWLAWLNRLGP